MATRKYEDANAEICYIPRLHNQAGSTSFIV